MKNLIYLSIFLFVPSLYAEKIVDELKSPVATEARNPFLYGAGLTLLTVILEDQVVDPVQNDTVEDKPLGKISPIAEVMGQLVPNAFYYLGMKINYWKNENTESNLNAEIMLKATFYSGLVTTVLKYTVREPRPMTGGARNSFPSGHTTSAFAFASSVGAIHGWKWGLPAYGIAAMVGYSRINDNAHYLHDVLAGATIGMGYGLGITYLLKKEQVSQNLVIYPLLNKSENGIAMLYQY